MERCTDERVPETAAKVQSGTFVKEDVIIEDITGDSDESDHDASPTEFVPSSVPEADLHMAIVPYNMPFNSYMPRESEDEVLNIRPLSMVPMTDSFVAEMEAEMVYHSVSEATHFSEPEVPTNEAAAKSDAAEFAETGKAEVPQAQVFKIPAAGGYAYAEEVADVLENESEQELVDETIQIVTHTEVLDVEEQGEAVEQPILNTAQETLQLNSDKGRQVIEDEACSAHEAEEAVHSGGDSVSEEYIPFKPTPLKHETSQACKKRHNVLL